MVKQAFVADAVSRPFVVGVIPVVGEFASALQPVIVVLNEGTMMTIQAVVSNDRRYVRLTVVPFFTQVGDVDTFTFEGTTSTTSSSENTNNNNDDNNSDSIKSDAETTHGCHGPVAGVPVHRRGDDRQRAGRRHRAVGRY